MKSGFEVRLSDPSKRPFSMACKQIARDPPHPSTNVAHSSWLQQSSTGCAPPAPPNQCERLVSRASAATPPHPPTNVQPFGWLYQESKGCGPPHPPTNVSWGVVVLSRMALQQAAAVASEPRKLLRSQGWDGGW